MKKINCQLDKIQSYKKAIVETKIVLKKNYFEKECVCT